MISYKTFVFYAFTLLCLTLAVLGLLLLVFKNFVLPSAHLRSHAGTSWIVLMAVQAFSLFFMLPRPIKLVLFKAIAGGTNFKVS